ALLVCQPLQRRVIWRNISLGLAVTLAGAFLLGAGVPVLLFCPNLSGASLLLSGISLSIIFSALASFTAVRIRDKAKGIGIAIVIWLYFSLIFDALLLFILFQFSDYPIEKTMLTLSFLNPVDISRILVLLQIDLSALMGYTGALFRNFFGVLSGQIITGL